MPEGLIRAPSGSLGEAFALPAATGVENWHGALFARGDLARAFLALRRGQVAWPGQPPFPLALCPIRDLGEIGPDRRRIHEAFDLYHDVSTLHPGFWDHEANQVRTLRQQPNAWLQPRATPRYADRTATADYADYPYHLWQMAADILLVERLWTITHRVLAVGFEQPVLGNTWWALKTALTPERRKALLLWLNGSLSLLAFFGGRVVTQSAWMQMKKPAWAAMPVLDVRTLHDDRVASLAAAYDALCERELQALAKSNVDPVRRAVDDALSAALGLPDLAPVRAMLAREPGLTGQSMV